MRQHRFFLSLSLLLLMAAGGRAQTTWLPFAAGIDSAVQVSQLHVAVDSLGLTLMAPGAIPQTREHVLLAARPAASWGPQDLTGLDSSMVGLLTWHRFKPGKELAVALDSAGAQHAYMADASGGWLALDSLWLSTFLVHNFLALDSLHFACGMNAANTHPTLILSLDSGLTWAPMSSPMPFALDSGLTSLAGHSSTLIMMAIDSLTGQHLFLTSPDAGASWNAPSTSFPGSATVRGLAVDSLGTFFACGHHAAGAGIWRSTDGGANWLPMDLSGIDVDSAFTAIAVVGDQLAVAGLDSAGRSMVYGLSLSSGISPAHETLSLQVWPNPAQGHCRMALPAASADEWQIDLMDLQGRILTRQRVDGHALRQGIELTLEGVSAGTYLALASDGHQRVTHKVVILP